MNVVVEAIVALLVVASGLLALIGAIGVLRMKDFFQRLHPTALATTLGTWCMALATIVYFSAVESRPALYAWAIPVLLSITVPVTSILLARAALFRLRGTPGTDLPPPLK
jgi:multicomponent K+:H+ antiporter subunit G